MEETAIFIILGLIVVGLTIRTFLPRKNKNRLSITSKSTDTIINDKVVVIKNATLKKVKYAVQQFYDKYNKDGLHVRSKLTIISESKFAVTFPQDIDFKAFCLFVNYMHYPRDISYKPHIKAWATTKQGDYWITKDIVNQKVMLYIPENDQEHDNVYLITSDNIAYKIGFGTRKANRLLDRPKNLYQEPIDIHKLREKKVENLKFE